MEPKKELQLPFALIMNTNNNLNYYYYFPDTLIPRRGYLSTLGPTHLKADFDRRAWEHLSIWELASGYTGAEVRQLRQELREAPEGHVSEGIIAVDT